LAVLSRVDRRDDAGRGGVEVLSLGTGPLRLKEFVSLARGGARAELSRELRERVARGRALVERFVSEGRRIYGVTTGFGDNVGRPVAEPEAARLQENILLSHCTSTGEPLPAEAVRGMMLMMLRNLGTGHSGVRPILLERIVEFLNRDLIPWVPAHGSVGYLAPEAHCALVLLGRGRAWAGGELLAGAEALARVGLEPLVLSYKEGLALVSGTTSATALLGLALWDARNAAAAADLIGAMSLEALHGTTRALDERLMAVRPHPEQLRVADNLRRILADSGIARAHRDDRLQDALSLRCMPQAHGAARRILADALETLEIEMNSCCDNPILVAEGDSGEVLSGCNADGGFVGLASDGLCMAAAYLAKISERRIDRMVNRHLSGLPAFLAGNPGLNSGFMIVQYAAAGLLGEMRILSHPASVDGVPTCAGQEDYVSMGYNGALKAYRCAGLLESVLAAELLTACQALDMAESLHPGLAPSPATGAVRSALRERFPFLEEDAYIHPGLEAARELIHSGELRRIAESRVGSLL